ncbi:hypothetical protein ABBQ38_010579 [Trebouxia sp. C0009 RCD-2024]
MNMSCSDRQRSTSNCRTSCSRNVAWAAVVAFGVLSATIAEGVIVAPPNTRSRNIDTSLPDIDPVYSSHNPEGRDPSQCTANLNFPAGADPAELKLSSQRTLLTATDRPAPKLSYVLQHTIPRKSFLEVPVTYASPQAGPSSTPSVPSPSSTLQAAAPYASPPRTLFSPPPPPLPVTSGTPAATPSPRSSQIPPPSRQSLPLPLAAALPRTTPSPSAGTPLTPAGGTIPSPAVFTASPGVSSSPAVTAAPVTPAVTATPTGVPVTDASDASPSPPSAVSPPSTSQPAGHASPTAPGPPSTPGASPAAPSTPSNPSSTPTGTASSSGAANTTPPQLQFAAIPFGYQPLVTAQATFLAIPANSLTTPQVAEVAADLQQALLNVTRTSIPVTAVVTPINAVPPVAAPMPNRRHLLQGGNTLQATVLFTATFATPPGSDSAVQTSIQAAVATAVAPLSVTTTATSTRAGSYDVAIVFPANNQVGSSTPCHIVQTFQS